MKEVRVTTSRLALGGVHVHSSALEGPGPDKGDILGRVCFSRVSAADSLSRLAEGVLKDGGPVAEAFAECREELESGAKDVDLRIAKEVRFTLAPVEAAS